MSAAIHYILVAHADEADIAVMVYHSQDVAEEQAAWLQDILDRAHKAWMNNPGSRNQSTNRILAEIPAVFELGCGWSWRDIRSVRVDEVDSGDA